MGGESLSIVSEYFERAHCRGKPLKLQDCARSRELRTLEQGMIGEQCSKLSCVPHRRTGRDTRLTCKILDKSRTNGYQRAQPFPPG